MAVCQPRSTSGLPCLVSFQVVGMSSRLGPALACPPMLSRDSSRLVDAPQAQSGLSAVMDDSAASNRWPEAHFRS